MDRQVQLFHNKEEEGESSSMTSLCSSSTSYSLLINQSSNTDDLLSPLLTPRNNTRSMKNSSNYNQEESSLTSIFSYPSSTSSYSLLNQSSYTSDTIIPQPSSLPTPPPSSSLSPIFPQKENNDNFLQDPSPSPRIRCTTANSYVSSSSSTNFSLSSSSFHHRTNDTSILDYYLTNQDQDSSLMQSTHSSGKNKNSVKCKIENNNHTSSNDDNFSLFSLGMSTIGCDIDNDSLTPNNNETMMNVSSQSKQNQDKKQQKQKLTPQKKQHRESSSIEILTPPRSSTGLVPTSYKSVLDKLSTPKYWKPLPPRPPPQTFPYKKSNRKALGIYRNENRGNIDFIIETSKKKKKKKLLSPPSSKTEQKKKKEKQIHLALEQKERQRQEQTNQKREKSWNSYANNDHLYKLNKEEIKLHRKIRSESATYLKSLAIQRKQQQLQIQKQQNKGEEKKEKEIEIMDTKIEKETKQNTRMDEDNKENYNATQKRIETKGRGRGESSRDKTKNNHQRQQKIQSPSSRTTTKTTTRPFKRIDVAFEKKKVTVTMSSSPHHDTKAKKNTRRKQQSTPSTSEKNEGVKPRVVQDLNCNDENDGESDDKNSLTSSKKSSDEMEKRIERLEHLLANLEISSPSPSQIQTNDDKNSGSENNADSSIVLSKKNKQFIDTSFDSTPSDDKTNAISSTTDTIDRILSNPDKFFSSPSVINNYLHNNVFITKNEIQQDIPSEEVRSPQHKLSPQNNNEIVKIEDQRIIVSSTDNNQSVQSSLTSPLLSSSSITTTTAPTSHSNHSQQLTECSTSDDSYMSIPQYSIDNHAHEITSASNNDDNIIQRRKNSTITQEQDNPENSNCGHSRYTVTTGINIVNPTISIGSCDDWLPPS